jgi:hypothetical protein
MDNCTYKNKLGNEVTQSEYYRLNNIKVVRHSDDLTDVMVLQN